MTRSPGKSSHATFSIRSLALKREEASKPAVIGIAATATVLVVALIVGCLYWFIRRRKRNGKGKTRERPRSAESLDMESTSLDDRTSKAPLIQQEYLNRSTSNRGSPAPRYDDDDTSSIAHSIPHRTLSTSTTRSLPPSYAAAVRASTEIDSQANQVSNNRSSHSGHRPGSSSGGSGGLRPLTLVLSQQQSQRSRSGSRPTTPEPANNHLPALLQQPPGRARAASRFREEDLDT